MSIKSTSASGITVSLKNPEDWTQFYPQNEILVTRDGRLIFPRLEYNIQGLDEKKSYSIWIHSEKMDEKKYTFKDNNWVEGPRSGTLKVHRIVEKEHPEGSQLGAHWMRRLVSFAHIKLSTNPEKADTIPVQPLHRFISVLTIRVDGEEEVFKLGATEFFPVTTYCNPKIERLKTSMNKYAMGHEPAPRKSIVRQYLQAMNSGPSSSGRCQQEHPQIYPFPTAPRKSNATLNSRPWQMCQPEFQEQPQISPFSKIQSVAITSVHKNSGPSCQPQEHLPIQSIAQNPPATQPPNPKSTGPFICYKNGKYVGMSNVQTRPPPSFSEVFSSLIKSGFKSKYMRPQPYYMPRVKPTSTVQRPISHEFESPSSYHQEVEHYPSSKASENSQDPSYLNIYL